LKLRIDQILEFARFEAGKTEVQIQSIDLQHLIDQLLDMVQPLARRRGNVLRSQLQGERCLEIDSDKIYQIILELLDNACKFTDHGIISLSANCTAQALVIEVTDTGIGIPPDQQALIFEPFRQLDMSETRSYGGTGLGLAITQRFCELLGGAITVASEPDHGSRFRVTIPLPVNPTFIEGPLEPVSQSEAAG
jgi:signal transduction histidine kinase